MGPIPVMMMRGEKSTHTFNTMVVREALDRGIYGPRISSGCRDILGPTKSVPMGKHYAGKPECHPLRLHGGIPKTVQ